jgi:flagellar basal-body rod protein FlgB
MTLARDVMPISDIPMLSLLRTKMHWHQQRQQLLAQNVANSDSPTYRPVDLVPLEASRKHPRLPPLALAQTDPAHAGGTFDGTPQLGVDPHGGYEIRPAGNAVNLEDEMMKVAANQMDYEAATTLYTHSLNLIKTALGKS